MDDKTSLFSLKKAIGYISIIIITMLATAGSGYLYGFGINEQLRNIIVTGIGSGMVVFCMMYARMNHGYAFDNESHISRFIVVYMLCIVTSYVFPVLPQDGWFYPVLALVLALFSNSFIGITALNLCLIISCMYADAFSSTYFIYAMSSLVTILIFKNINEKFKIGIPVFISLAVLLMTTMAQSILFLNVKMSVEILVIPFVNLFVTGILFLIVLRGFSAMVVHRYRSKYMELNDQECELLVKLKSEDKSNYYHSIHCAYLCERIASKLNLDVALTKAGGYYHKVGCLKGNNNAENCMLICDEYKFPPDLKNLLREYTDKHQHIATKEAVVVNLVDTVITSIMYLLEKDKNAEVDYKQIIDFVFRNKIEKGTYKKSLITFHEYSQIKQLLIEENLYYDFLR